MEPKLFDICTIFITILILRINFNGAISLCQEKNCQGDQCPKIECLNGTCQDNGGCLCRPCWTEKTCGKYKNEYFPKFAASKLEASINNFDAEDSVVMDVGAVDKDVEMTCNNIPEDCDCARIVYKIEFGNDAGIFSLDADTGRLRLARRIPVQLHDSVVSIKVSASNVARNDLDGSEVGIKDFANVNVKIGSGHEFHETNDIDDLHARIKRAAPNMVDNITFTLSKSDKYNYTTVMYVGSMIHLILQIQFAARPIDLNVELFSPENGTAIMVICNPNITHSGSNLVYNQTGALPVLDSIDFSNRIDRVILNFGTVLNTAASTSSPLDSMVIIEWDVIMISSSVMLNNTVYWISAGAEYYNSSEIWVGQTGMISNIDNYMTSSTLPTFNVTGPDTLELDGTAVFHVDVYMPYPATELIFDAFAPLNFTDSLTMCSALVDGYGEGYNCYNSMTATSSIFPSNSGLTNDRVTLYIGKLVNKYSRESGSSSQNLIAIEFAVSMPNNEAYLGQTLWLGATLQIGTDQIWASQISVNIVAATPPTAPGSVPGTLFDLLVPGSQASYYRPFPLQFNISIPPGSRASYKLTVTGPVDQYLICGAVAMYRGLNVPCVNSSVPILSSTGGTTGILNQLDWTIGIVKNTNQRTPAEDSQASTLQIIVYVTPVSHSSNTVGSSANIDAYVTYTSGAVTPTLSRSVTISDVVAKQVIYANSTPTANLTTAFGNTVVYVNQSIDLRLTVYLYPEVLYNPFNVTITTPTANGVNYASIALMDIIHVGSNLPCFNMLTGNKAINYTFITDEDEFNGAYLASVTACNSAKRPRAFYNLTLQDAITFRTQIYFSSQTAFTTPTISALVSFGSDQILTKALIFTLVNTNNVDYSASQIMYAQIGHLNFTTTTASPGSIFYAQVLLKLPPQSVADWTVRANTLNSPYMTICAIFVQDYGSGVPYLNRTMPMRSIIGANGVGEAWLDLYKLTNINPTQFTSNSYFDSNSVALLIAIQVAGNTPAGTNLNLNVTVDHGMNGVDYSNLVTFGVVAAGAPTYSASDPSIVPTFTFGYGSINANETAHTNQIYLGETFIVLTEVTVPDAMTAFDLEVVVSSPASPLDVFDLVAMDVVHVGANVPCLLKTLSNAATTIRPTSTLRNDANIVLGKICVIPVDRKYPASRKIIVETVVTISRETTMPVGSSIILSSNIKINGTLLTGQTLSMTLATITPTEVYNFNAMLTIPINLFTTDPTVGLIGPNTEYLFQSNLTILANCSAQLSVKFECPISISAVLTVLEIKIISFGMNLGSINANTKFVTTYSNTTFSSENDVGNVVLGFVTNTGHSYRSGKFKPDDDNIMLTVNVKMMDAVGADQATTWPLTITSTFGLYSIKTNKTFRVLRTFTEVPDPIFDFYLDPSVVYTPANQLAVINIHLGHLPTSKAEMKDVAVLIYLPDFLTYSSHVHNFIGPNPLFTLSTNPKFISFTFANIFFSDDFTLNVTLTMTGTRAGGLNSAELTAISYQVIYFIIFRTGHSLPSGQFLNTTIAQLKFNSIPPYVEQCLIQSLNGLLSDCQISGSQTADGSSVLGFRTAAGWKPGVHVGAHKPYLQINFVNFTKVTEIILTHISVTKVSQFRIDTSVDGFKWVTGTIVSYVSDGVGIGVTNAKASRFAKFVVESVTDSNQPILKVDLRGCVTNSIVAEPLEECQIFKGWQPLTPNPDMINRLVLGTSTAGYICDTNPESGSLGCFQTTDGLSWKELPANIANVIGYLPSTGELFAIDSNKQSILVTIDNGLTWNSAPPARYALAKATVGYVAAVAVSYSTAPVVSSGQLTSSFMGVSWAGIQKANWMSCCP